MKLVEKLTHDSSVDEAEKVLSEVKEWQKDREPAPTTNEQDNRLAITKLFLWLFFGSIWGTFIFCWFYNFTIKHTSIEPLRVLDILSTITNTLGTALGFIMGYYFKDRKA